MMTREVNYSSFFQGGTDLDRFNRFISSREISIPYCKMTFFSNITYYLTIYELLPFSSNLLI